VLFAAENPWAWHPHPEVWMLVAFLIGAYIYAVRVIGPTAVAPGQTVVTKAQIRWFIGAILMLWAASDWPIHDLGEKYLYSAHMLQHMMLSYFMPPMVLLATPEWLLRAIIGKDRVYRILKWLCHPVVAGLAFNIVVMTTHIPGVVNHSVKSAPLHYGLHVLVVSTGLLMWMPVVGPFRELRIGDFAKMIYLFAQSVVPTVPAGWLVFAEGAVYKVYDIPTRVWGLTVQDDQQLAGAIMKTGGSVFLWTVIGYYFFKTFNKQFRQENSKHSYRRDGQIPTAEITGHDELDLTYDAVTAEFDRTEPAADPHSSPH
jgi:putative membrane protein